jgi:hypothetical protein
MKTKEMLPKIQKGYELLEGEYYALSLKLTIEVIVFRIISLVWLVIILVQPDRQLSWLVLVALNSIFTSVIWKMSIMVLEHDRERLEHALIDSLLDDDDGEMEKVYAEWQHGRWIQHKLWRIKAVEPFLWLTFTLGIAVLRWLVLAG